MLALAHITVEDHQTYPQLDFAQSQARTDSGVSIRDLIFYNTRSTAFLGEMLDDYGARQITFELKNVKSIAREHVDQLNRYLADELGRFGVFVTRNPGHRYLLDLAFLDFFAAFFDTFFELVFAFFCIDFLAFFTLFFGAPLAVAFGAFAAFDAALTAFFTGAGVFSTAVLRTRFATTLTAVSASAPAAVASRSVI